MDIITIAYIVAIAAIIVYAVWTFKFKNKAYTIPINIIRQTATGATMTQTKGEEFIKDSQRYLNIKSLGKKIEFPKNAQFIGGAVYYIQLDRDTVYPMTLRTSENMPFDLRGFVEGLRGTDLSKPEEAKQKVMQIVISEINKNPNLISELKNYFVNPKLEPVEEPAFKQIYADNVKQILRATAEENKSLLDKFMPVILVIATGIGLVLVGYAINNLFAGTVAPLTNVAVSLQNIANQLSGLHASCSTVISNSTGTTTVPNP